MRLFHSFTANERIQRTMSFASFDAHLMVTMIGCCASVNRVEVEEMHDACPTTNHPPPTIHDAHRVPCRSTIIHDPEYKILYCGKTLFQHSLCCAVFHCVLYSVPMYLRSAPNLRFPTPTCTSDGHWSYTKTKYPMTKGWSFTIYCSLFTIHYSLELEVGGIIILCNNNMFRSSVSCMEYRMLIQ